MSNVPPTHLDHDLYTAVGELLNDRLNPDQRLDLQTEERGVLGGPGVNSPPLPWGLILPHLGAEAVRHELEVTIRWDKGNGAVVVKTRQSHTLVKFHILQFHGFVLAP